MLWSVRAGFVGRGIAFADQFDATFSQLKSLFAGKPNRIMVSQRHGSAKQREMAA